MGSPLRKVVARVGIAVLVVVALSWLAVRTIRNTRPYSIDAAALSGWTLVVADSTDPALVVLEPRSLLPTELFRQLVRRSGQTLIAPVHPSVPLVLKSEYSDSLQGVLSVADVLDVAREVGVEGTRFEPVCMGQRRASAPGRSDQLFFVLFDAPAFNEFRRQLTPLFPEHAGAGFYDPAALRPILMIAATDREFAHWWPMTVEERTDCLASLSAN